MSGAQGDEAEENRKDIEMWKIKRLIKNLEAARGNGTSMISLVIPPKDQVSRVSKMLADEYGTASNIKSRVNRLSVLGAITSAQQRLKLYHKVPPNGLVIYVGTVMNEEGKEKKMTIDFEPFKAINTSLYLCDNRFHTEALGELLENDDRFGFIIMDGNGSLFGAVSGNTREILQKISVDLPKKHGRGGQSALRFARLRLEKRHNYVRKVAELAVQHFITDDRPNVRGIILAGLAEFKNELSTSDLLDKRLAEVIVKIVDVSYGGENGFNQAIELSQEALANVKFVQEKKLISQYFEEIALDTGKYCFGVKDTLAALEMGAVDTLITWEDLKVTRYTLRRPKVTQDSKEGETKGDDSDDEAIPEGDLIKFLTPEQEEGEKLDKELTDEETGQSLDVLEKVSLIEWLAQNYEKFGARLEFISDKSQEGSQFCQGFGGIGGLLRYQVDFSLLSEENWAEDDDLLGSDEDLLDADLDELDGFL
jgi:peptide chain release factor subunit 1